MLRTQEIVEELEDFCISLGGEPERTEWDFGCKVDPRKVLENWDRFVELLKKTAGNPDLHGIYFGKEDLYIYYMPERRMGGVRITKYFSPLSEEKEVELYEEVEGDFYDFMRSKGLEPEFVFIPRVDMGYWEGQTYVDVEAEVTEPELDTLKDIAKAMMKFKKELNEIIEKFI